MDLVDAGGLQVARTLYDFVNDEAIPGTGIEADGVLAGLCRAGPRPGAAQQGAARPGATRCSARSTPGTWSNRGKPIDIGAYAEFLREIGYLQPEPADFSIGTENVDPEIASIAGPQLVVPVTNARYALNAANARWGSLYDALYGTDAIPEDGGADARSRLQQASAARGWSPRPAQVLDQAAPLAIGSHRDATRYAHRRRPARGHAEGQRADRAGAAGAVRRLSRRRRRPDRRCC